MLRWITAAIALALIGCQNGRISDQGPSLRIQSGAEPMTIVLPIIGAVTLSPFAVMEWTAGVIEILQPSGADESATLTRDPVTGMATASTGSVPPPDPTAATNMALTWAGIGLVCLAAVWLVFHAAIVSRVPWLAKIGPMKGALIFGGIGVGFIFLPGVMAKASGPIAWLLVAGVAVVGAGLVVWILRSFGLDMLQWKKTALQHEAGVDNALAIVEDDEERERLKRALMEKQDGDVQAAVRARKGKA